MIRDLEVVDAIELVREELSNYVDLDAYVAAVDELTAELVQLKVARATIEQVLRDKGLSDQQVRVVRRELLGDVDKALGNLRRAL